MTEELQKSLGEKVREYLAHGSCGAALLIPFLGFGDQPGDIWLSINTDGVKVYRTSKKDTWPVWAINLNLPPSQRYKLQNLMLLGIYFGQEKPALSQYLTPIFENLNRAKKPFYVQFEGRQGYVSCRAQVISCPVDMDARVCGEFHFKYAIYPLISLDWAYSGGF